MNELEFFKSSYLFDLLEWQAQGYLRWNKYSNYLMSKDDL